MEALERFYSEYLMGYAQYNNFEGYSVDEQMTKDRIENILAAGYMSFEDAAFVRSLLPDIEIEKIKADIEDYLESMVIL